MNKSIMPSRSSVFLGAIVTILLLLHPTSTSAENASPGGNGLLLLGQIEQLHDSLTRVTALLATANIPENEAIISKTAGLITRVRSLVLATEKYQPTGRERRLENNRRLRQHEQRVAERRRLRQRARYQLRQEDRELLRGVGNGEAVAILSEQDQKQKVADQVPEEQRNLVDYVEMEDLARDLYETTITFPECKERYLDDCLTIINSQMEELQLDAELIIHEKRGIYQEGYNKVVLVTDMTASYVKGQNNDGIVSYPFPWDDSVTQVTRMLGVDGRWDCHAQAPEDCCAMIKSSVPNPDINGNYIECHVFIPFGGVGNKKRDDRIFINLSPDGRVHEAPHVD